MGWRKEAIEQKESPWRTKRFQRRIHPEIRKQTQSQHICGNVLLPLFTKESLLSQAGKNWRGSVVNWTSVQWKDAVQKFENTRPEETLWAQPIFC